MFGTKHLKTNRLQKAIEYEINEPSTKYSNWSTEKQSYRMFQNISTLCLQFLLLFTCTKLVFNYIKQARCHCEITNYWYMWFRQIFNYKVVIARCLVQYWQIFSSFLIFCSYLTRLKALKVCCKIWKYRKILLFPILRHRVITTTNQVKAVTGKTKNQKGTIVEMTIMRQTKNAQCSKKFNVTMIYPHKTGVLKFPILKSQFMKDIRHR